MKKIFIALAVCAFSLSSCMINEHVIGNGGSTESARKKTIYIIGNRISEVDSKALSGNAADYTIDTRTNFVDMLINGITFGVVNTRTVIIKK